MDPPSNDTSKSKHEEEKIDRDELEIILQKSQNNYQLKVIHCTMSNLMSIGENYGSDILKIEAKVRKSSDEQEEVLHLVAKTIKHTETPYFNWTIVLQKEIFAYSELLPMYRDLERDVGIAENDLIDITPKYMGHRFVLKEGSDEVDDLSLLLMENLKAHGYDMANRAKGLDMAHASIALKNLAKYHALSIVLQKKRPNDFERAKSQAANLGFYSGLMRNGTVGILPIFKEDPCFAKHLSKIEASFEHCMENSSTSVELTEPWITIIHGDFWTNNLLFHKDSQGEVDDVKFVDFQMYLYTSPCRDLSYFFCCSLDEEATDRLNELIDLYYNTFISTLKRMEIDPAPFSRQLFDEELKKQAIVGFPHFSLCIKYFSYEVSEDDKKEKDIALSVMQSKCSELYKKKLLRLIQIYEDRQWF